jgi:hypothetical protein
VRLSCFSPVALSLNLVHCTLTPYRDPVGDVSPVSAAPDAPVSAAPDAPVSEPLCANTTRSPVHEPAAPLRPRHLTPQPPTPLAVNMDESASPRSEGSLVRFQGYFSLLIFTFLNLLS